jgi:hypothetical protein
VTLSLDDLRAAAGSDLGTSGWFPVTSAMVDAVSRWLE